MSQTELRQSNYCFFNIFHVKVNVKISGSFGLFGHSFAKDVQKISKCVTENIPKTLRPWLGIC